MGYDIGWAVQQMLDEGKRVRRSGWNGKGMWIAVHTPPLGNMITLPFVYMSTVTGATIPWLCSQADLLATDWEIAEP